jgi:hypothetical protein
MPPGSPLVTVSRAPPQAFGTPRPGEVLGGSASTAAMRASFALVDAYEPLCPRSIPGRYFGRDPGLHALDQPGYDGEAWIAGGAATDKVAILARTQSTITLGVDAAPGATVIVNQNWDPGWQAAGATAFADPAGLLAVRPSAPSGRIRLRYRPPRLGWGLLAFAAGVALLATSLGRERSRARRVSRDEAETRP